MIPTSNTNILLKKNSVATAVNLETGSLCEPDGTEEF